MENAAIQNVAYLCSRLRWRGWSLWSFLEEVERKFPLRQLRCDFLATHTYMAALIPQMSETISGFKIGLPNRN